jgi:hypothetical protein
MKLIELQRMQMGVDLMPAMGAKPPAAPEMGQGSPPQFEAPMGAPMAEMPPAPAAGPPDMMFEEMPPDAMPNGQGMPPQPFG